MLRVQSLTLCALLSCAGFVHAGDEKPPAPAPAGEEQHDQTRSPVTGRYEYRPCFGRGYVPYSYPAADSCPCSDRGCYDPAGYYCGGKRSRRAWWKRWVGAHLGHGSMLDAYPCRCRYPAAGRPRQRRVYDGGVSPDDAGVPPLPEPRSTD